MKIVSGALIASDAAINVECGFAPDFVRLWTAIGGTELLYEWYKALVDTSAGTGQYGILVTQGSATGVPTTAATGIIPYDASVIKALMPAPNGSGLSAKEITGTFAEAKAASVTPTARTTSVVGEIIRATVSTGFLYECTVQGGAMTSLTEPTWSLVLGETTSDGSNTWITRVDKTKLVGVKGFTIGVTVATNGEILAFKAEEHNRSEDMGDADSQSPVRFASSD